MSKNFLENAYWISQVVLAVIATIAAFAAFVQIRTFKLFEMLKYMESLQLRNSRRIVLREIYKRRGEEWWNDPADGDRLESAASDVCASYDVLGRMIEFDSLERVFPIGGYGAFFRKFWARSIVQNHEALKVFLTHRRTSHPDAYSAFTRLAEEALVNSGKSIDRPLDPN
jgi:hypothetical protein